LLEKTSWNLFRLDVYLAGLYASGAVIGDPDQMKPYKHYLKVVHDYRIVIISVIAAVIASSLVSMCHNDRDISGLKKMIHEESVYEHVMRTGTIRCGYMSSRPGLIVDPETKQMSGLFYDYMMEVGKLLNLKVEFVQDLNIIEYPDALNSGKIDAMCTGVGISADRGKYTDFITPLYYSPVYMIVRADENRLEDNPMLANNSNFTMIYIEGGIAATLRKYIYPRSTPLELPRVARSPDMFLSLASHEGDFVLGDIYNYNEFTTKNPGKIKQASTKPVFIIPVSIAIKNGEREMQSMLAYATQQLQFSGVMDRLLDKYEKYPGMFYRTVPPYRKPEAAK
jgi:ABC-type amino acid transport substrate-binding protein